MKTYYEVVHSETGKPKLAQEQKRGTPAYGYATKAKAMRFCQLDMWSKNGFRRLAMTGQGLLFLRRRADMNELIDGWLEHKARMRVAKAKPLTFNQFLIYVRWAKAARG